MKVAFVDNLPVGGGLSRFSLLLCKSLVEYDSDLLIDYYIHYDNLKHIPEVKTLGERVVVKILRSTLPPGLLKRIFEKIYRKLVNKNLSGIATIGEIEKVITGQYDLAYFPSAHMMQRPSLSIPLVGTLHDFNWKYFFGRSIFPLSFVQMMDVEIMKWMQGSTICSSLDVVDEARKLYPEAMNYPTVVHIAPVIINKDLSEQKAKEILAQLDIDHPYIIFPGNFFPHKNHLNLFTAFSILKRDPCYKQYKLILTGMNSDQVPYGIAEYRGVRVLTHINDQSYYDVRGLGYQANEVVDALIKMADLLVSPSIYEAICTPAMDAWNFGTPTAISDIPAFREHAKEWGVVSNYFDPMDPKNIAATIKKALHEYDQARKDGLLSKQKMASYTWEDVARGYLQVFNHTISNT